MTQRVVGHGFYGRPDNGLVCATCGRPQYEHLRPMPGAVGPPPRPATRMSFPSAVRTCLVKYAVFSGRASRAEYWWFYLFNIVIVFGSSFVAAALSTNQDVGSVVLGGWVVIFVLPALAVSIRRLHDTDRTGWWYLLCLVPFLGGLILLVFMALDGTRGPNRYGPQP